eukprot:TRINITY_DN7461_c0_g1_i1.p1 TRINITY_DN7461_c0_g1~~TRINITY_DN7461_c0_g1_i1.p1  ORF type:complete len:535 (+),score=127.11 TRINITY_DN7461_c0_g1_i1:32-1606(+)
MSAPELGVSFSEKVTLIDGHHSPQPAVPVDYSRMSLKESCASSVVLAEVIPEPEPVSTLTRLTYSCGVLVERTHDTVILAISMTFFNQVLGLSGSLSSLAVTLALLIDAVCDPAVGVLSDPSRSPIGRRHPFMYAALGPLVASFGLLFNPSSELSKQALFWWITVFMVLLRCSVSLYSVPFMALGAELSSNSLERNRIMGSQAAVGYFCAPLVLFVGLTWLLADPGDKGNGLLNRSNYPPFVLLCGLVMLVGGLTAAAFTHPLIQRLPQAEHTIGGLRQFARDLLTALRNRNFACVVFAYVFFSLNLGVGETLTMLVGIFFWRLSPGEIAWFTAMVPIAAVVTPPLIVTLAKRFEKRTLVIAAALNYCVWPVFGVVLRLAGVIPNEHPLPNEYLVLLYFLYMLGNCALVAHNVLVMVMLADVAEEHETVTGQRTAGIFYSARTLIGKSASALGHIIGGVGLDYIGFTPHMRLVGAPPNIVRRLGFLSLVGSVGGLFAAVCYAFYRIDRARQAEISTQLAKLRET